MRRTRWNVLVGFVLGAVAFCVVLTAIDTAREDARRTRCLSNLHQLGIAFANYASAYNGRCPTGTIVLPDIPVERRLSWLVAIEPQLSGDAYRGFDRSAPADSERNLTSKL